MATIPTRQAIAQTYALILPHLRVTPVLHTSGAGFGGPAVPLTLKLEQLQHAGSFKARGAFANLMLPALAASETWAQSSGAMPVHAFDQLETLLGQGTLGLELSQQAPDVDTVLAAVGGGGHIGGIAAWYRGDVRVVGVEPRLAPTMYDALQAGHPVDAPAGSVAADSLAPKRVGELAFPIAKAFVDRVVLVDDDDILRAQATLWDAARIVAEPGGATALAALLSGAYTPAPGERVAVIVCGGNTTAVKFQ